MPQWILVDEKSETKSLLSSIKSAIGVPFLVALRAGMLIPDILISRRVLRLLQDLVVNLIVARSSETNSVKEIGTRGDWERKAAKNQRNLGLRSRRFFTFLCGHFPPISSFFLSLAWGSSRRRRQRRETRRNPMSLRKCFCIHPSKAWHLRLLSIGPGLSPGLRSPAHEAQSNYMLKI